MNLIYIYEWCCKYIIVYYNEYVFILLTIKRDIIKLLMCDVSIKVRDLIKYPNFNILLSQIKKDIMW